MKYAIIQIGPFQYTVEEGKEYSVPKFQAEEGKAFNDAQVLLVAENDSVKVGAPIVGKAKVQLDILGQEKGEKIQTQVYKAKSRYRRKRGFRKQVTRFKVASIVA